MTEQEMLEAEKYWCENCCNWDKEEVQMDACSTCKLTGTRVFAQESGKECKCFNVPAENVIVPPCKVGQILYVIEAGLINEAKVKEYKYCSNSNNGVHWHIVFEELFAMSEAHIGKTVFLTREEAEQALKGGAE